MLQLLLLLLMNELTSLVNTLR